MTGSLRVGATRIARAAQRREWRCVDMLALSSARIAQETIRLEAHRDPAFAFRCVCQVITVFRRLDGQEQRAFLDDAMRIEPRRGELERKWDAFLAGVLAREARLAGLPESSYRHLNQDERLILDTSWFYRENPKTVGYLLANTPAELKYKRVFVDPGSLESL
ncbi:MAG: hypothetical protein WAX14_11415 [Rhodococcus sp. (in: high G+C Gram-positive bacteria)]|uniref:hypothetical protein n=1 Tax=Rhodococcus sp. TaxID=1831 RepID=UPI003BB70196